MKKKILIVDDSEITLNALRAVMSDHDFEVHTSQGINTALKLMMQNHYHLILSDIAMPKLSGFDFIKLAKYLGYRIPFLFISALTDEATRVQAKQLSGKPMFQKNNDMTLLPYVVASYI